MKKNCFYILIGVLFLLNWLPSLITAFAEEAEIKQQDILGNVKEYHNKNITGKKIKIAVMDTGVDLNQQDLILTEGRNFVNEDQEDYSDKNGHGTKIAGIIGAKENGQGMIGIAPDSEFYIAKVANDNGLTNFEALTKGLEWAIDKQVDIINISLEFEEADSKVQAVLKKAATKNIIVIASSGNVRYEGDVFNAYPGADKNVISVGMLNKNGKLYSPEFHQKNVDVFFPGEDLTATYLNNKLTLDTGVSFATAYASGFACLIIQELKAEQVAVNQEEVLMIMQSKVGKGKGGMETSLSKLFIVLISSSFVVIIGAVITFLLLKKYQKRDSLI